MGVELKGTREGLYEAIRRRGHVTKLPDAPDGPIIPAFHPRLLAGALRQEIERARKIGWTKISLHMDVEDAVALAAALDVIR
ncbi:MAG: hypothetical protein ACRD1X_17935 [Vicinamibacteria bacterium]